MTGRFPPPRPVPPRLARAAPGARPAAAPGDPTLEDVRCPHCTRLLLRWRALEGKIETMCPRCRVPVAVSSVAQVPVGRPVG